MKSSIFLRFLRLQNQLRGTRLVHCWSPFQPNIPFLDGFHFHFETAAAPLEDLPADLYGHLRSQLSYFSYKTAFPVGSN